MLFRLAILPTNRREFRIIIPGKRWQGTFPHRLYGNRPIASHQEGSDLYDTAFSLHITAALRRFGAAWSLKSPRK